MTAILEQAPRTPPRFAVRTVWLLHRAAYRISRGRFGLSRPAIGSRFGMLRLATIGRRSGQARVAIVGYYEDGPNLVTLAMNGWGRKDPAWWLNLRAQPDTTVELPDGPRAVRARAATGAERERLWAGFQAFPGWGDDVDALAARRATETSVVVLEPRTTATGGRHGEVARLAPVASAAPGQVARVGLDLAAAPVARPRRLSLPRLSVRHLWLVPGLAVAFLASAQAGQYAVGLLPLLLFGIVPHLTVLAGLGQPHGRGQLAPRAVPLFNAMHHPAAPLALLGLAATGVLSPFWLVGALAWLGHIVVDLGLGDGLRTPDGWRRRSWLSR